MSNRSDARVLAAHSHVLTSPTKSGFVYAIIYQDGQQRLAKQFVEQYRDSDEHPEFDNEMAYELLTLIEILYSRYLLRVQEMS